MSMDATLQVRMDGQIKNNVEELYRNLGTSFAEAEIDRKLAASEEDILTGHILSQAEADERLKAKFHHG